MQELLERIQEKLAQGITGVLCLLTASQGSTPRTAGARMAVFADGTLLQTVGGGSIERRAVQEAGQLLRESAWEHGQQLRYQWNLAAEEEAIAVCLLQGLQRQYRLEEAEEGEREEQQKGTPVGMACGGSTEFVFLLLEPENPQLGVFLTTWQSRLKARKGGCLQLLAAKPGTSLIYKEEIRSPNRAFLFGTGHVGRALCRLLSVVGYEVVLLEETLYSEKSFLSEDGQRWKDRSQKESLLRQKEELLALGASRVMVGAYPELCRELTLQPEDFAVVLTAGHRSDCEVLAQLLDSPVGYLGCIGSKQKAAAVRARLEELGFSQKQIGRIHSPVGLRLGGRKPEEIAVSIAAEMQAWQYGRLEEWMQMSRS